VARGQTKTAIIRPILIDREIPRLQARLDELNKLAGQNNEGSANNPGVTANSLTADQQKEFIEVTNRLKLLGDRRALLLIRAGDEYLTDPPKLPAKP